MSLGPTPTPLALRALRQFERGAPDECWPWTGAQDGKGYGSISVRVTGGKRRGGWRSAKAHRVVYEMLIGPIPEGLQLDHLCRVRHCVNPAHLEPVTNRENGLRGVSPAAVNAAKTHCINGHEYTAENTYVKSPCGFPTRECRTCAVERMRRSAWSQHTHGRYGCATCGVRYESARSMRIHCSKLGHVEPADLPAQRPSYVAQRRGAA